MDMALLYLLYFLAHTAAQDVVGGEFSPPPMTIYPSVANVSTPPKGLSVFAAAASCPTSAHYAMSYASTDCLLCTAGQYRSVSTPWAPMRMTWNGNTWTYANRYYFNVPVYYGSPGGGWGGTMGYTWWWYSQWIWSPASSSVDGSTCGCYNGGWGGFPAPGGTYWNGEYNTMQPVISQSSSIEYCIDCPANLVCPIGTYISYRCSDGMAAECTSCPAGKYNAATGQAECIPCAPGTYSPSGQSSCTPCAEGSFSTGGASSCSPCAAGLSAPVMGMAACVACTV